MLSRSRCGQHAPAASHFWRAYCRVPVLLPLPPVALPPPVPEPDVPRDCISPPDWFAVPLPCRPDERDRTFTSDPPEERSRVVVVDRVVAEPRTLTLVPERSRTLVDTPTATPGRRLRSIVVVDGSP